MENIPRPANFFEFNDDTFNLERLLKLCFVFLSQISIAVEFHVTQIVPGIHLRLHHRLKFSFTKKPSTRHTQKSRMSITREVKQTNSI